MVEPIGRLDALKNTYDDPTAHFKKIAEERTEERKESKTIPISIEIDSVLEKGEDNLKNVGYGIIKELYLELELDKFWRWKVRGRSFKYNAELIFRLLVTSRVLFPSSKKETYENRGVYFEKIDGFSLDDVYSSLDLIDENQKALQKWIFKRSEKIVKRDLSVSYFDCRLSF
jgi:hypothetical protein